MSADHACPGRPTATPRGRYGYTRWPGAGTVVRGLGRRGRVRRAREHGPRPGQQPLLPVVDQRRVVAELGGHLVDRLVPLQGGQGAPGLERRRVLLPLRHRTTSGTAGSSLPGGPKSGVHYRDRVLSLDGNAVLTRGQE